MGWVLWVSVGGLICGGSGWVAVVVVSLCSIQWVSRYGFFLQFGGNFFSEEIYEGKSELVIGENIL